MTTKRKLRYEIARLNANTGYLEYMVDTLTADNDALLKERDDLRAKCSNISAENKALLDTVSALCDKNKELAEVNKTMRLKIMSLEAMWGAMQRRKESA